LYRLLNTLLDGDMQASEQIAHLPGSIATLPPIDLEAASATLAAATRAHLARRGEQVQVALVRARVLAGIRIARAADPGSVSIIIPTRDRRELLEACVDSLQPALRKRDCELIVVDNDSSDPATLDYLSAIDGRVARVLRLPGDFNFARLNNAA